MEAATEASANGPDPASSRGPAPNGPARERPAREGPGPERPDEAEADADIVVSATELGQYADWRFCPRCAWVRRQVKQLPFQGFPGIFSSIDRYNKLIVRNHFERESRPPDWLSSVGEIQEHISPPHWSSFKAEDANSGVTLRGEADAIFRMSDGSYAIIDYKTSRYNPDQRGILQAYRAQLNAYAYIGERGRVLSGIRIGLGLHGSPPLERRRPRTPLWWTLGASLWGSAPGWSRWIWRPRLWSRRCSGRSPASTAWTPHPRAARNAATARPRNDCWGCCEAHPSCICPFCIVAPGRG